MDDVPELDDRSSPDAVLLEETPGKLKFDVGARGSLTFAPPTASLADALRALPNGLGASERAAYEQSPDFDGIRFEFYLLQLRKMRMIEIGLRGRVGALMVVIPHRMSFELAGKYSAGTTDLRLSRFACLRTTERGVVLESPEASTSVVLSDARTMVWIHGLKGEPVASHDNDPDSDERTAAIDLLWRCGFLEDASKPESPARESWEFHDRLFHGASRPGNVLRPVGGSFRFQDKFPSPPAVKPRMDGERLELAAPDLASVARRSGTLLDVMQQRRSFRAMGDPPVSLTGLTEFLYRIARFVDVIDAPLQDLAMRVYPSGGAIHEIEFYLSVRDCGGLAPGFYHYHAFDHALDHLLGAAAQAETIIRRAGEDWGQPDEPPQVVVTLASRLPRLAWKYDTVAYRATMMNAGVAVQTMYLVAEDMNLGCAPAGRGDPAVFAAATGLDPFEETSILEIGLGTRDTELAPALERAAAQSGRRQRQGQSR